MKTGTYTNDMETVKKLIHEVDFDKLKKQIKAIYAAQTALTAIGGKENLDTVTELDGIVHYFDAMRDIAVDVYEYEEKKVFDLSDEEVEEIEPELRKGLLENGFKNFNEKDLD